MAEITLREVFNRVYNNVYASPVVQRPMYTTTVDLTTDNQTVLEVEDATMWAKNDILEVQTTGELMFVLSVDLDNDELTVIRAYGGTEALDPNEAVSLLVKNPVFTQKQIWDSVFRTADSLSSFGVEDLWAYDETFNIGSGTVVPEGWQFWIGGWDAHSHEGPQTPADVISVVLEVDDTGGVVHLPHKVINSGEAGNLQLTVFRSGRNISSADTIRVTFSTRASYQFDLQDDPVIVGPFAGDLAAVIEFGATAQLLASTMGPRALDPGRFTDRTVQPGQGGRDARWYQGEYFVRLKALSQSLAVEKRRMRKGEPYISSYLRRRVI